jgi:hypothetical protein
LAAAAIVFMKAQLNKPYNIPAYVVRGTNAITTES